MNDNDDFIKSLFEKLAKLGPDHLQPDKLKQNPLSTADKTPSAGATPSPLNTPKNDEKVSAPGTPQGSEKRSIKEGEPSGLKKSDPLGDKLDRNSVRQNEKNQKGTEEKNQTYEGNVGQNGLGDHEEKKDEIAQKMEQFHLQVGDEQYLLDKNQLVELQQQAAQLAAQKAAQKATQQTTYQVVQPLPPVSKIRRGTFVSIHSVIIVLVLATLPLVEAFSNSLIEREKKKAKEEEFSFFVNTYLFHRPIELGEPVVATESCDPLNALYNLNPKLEQFMVGRVAGILDEARYYVNIQVFPNKLCVYTKDRAFLTPFISLYEVSSYTWPKIQKPSWQLIGKYLVKLKKNKHYRNIVKFMNYHFFSSK